MRPCHCCTRRLFDTSRLRTPVGKTRFSNTAVPNARSHQGNSTPKLQPPNTPGLRELQEKESLRKIFTELQLLNKHQKPILLKIAPDLETSALDDIISLTDEVNIAGLVSSNTTLDRSLLNTQNQLKAAEIGLGGLSGQPLLSKSTAILSYLHKGLNGRIPIIASGGIFTGADAQEKMNAGADLVQVWTGFIYEGPGIVKNICSHL